MVYATLGTIKDTSCSISSLSAGNSICFHLDNVSVPKLSRYFIRLFNSYYSDVERYLLKC